MDTWDAIFDSENRPPVSVFDFFHFHLGSRFPSRTKKENVDCLNNKEKHGESATGAVPEGERC